MDEQTFQTIVIITLFVTSLLQAIMHAITWWALDEQPPSDPIGYTLKRREGAMALKGAARTFFEYLLMVLVIGGELPFHVVARDSIYSVTTILTLYAVFRFGQFIWALWHNNWGRVSSRGTK